MKRTVWAKCNMMKVVASPVISVMNFTSLDHTEVLTQELKNCFQNGTFSDVTITCEHESVQAHQLVLAAASPYLKEVLEGRPDENVELIVPDVKMRDLKLLLSMLYKGNVTTTHEEMKSVLELAVLLKVDAIINSSEHRQQLVIVNNGTDVSQEMCEVDVSVLIDECSYENAENTVTENVKIASENENCGNVSGNLDAGSKAASSEHIVPANGSDHQQKTYVILLKGNSEVTDIGDHQVLSMDQTALLLQREDGDSAHQKEIVHTFKKTKLQSILKPVTGPKATEKTHASNSHLDMKDQMETVTQENQLKKEPSEKNQCETYFDNVETEKVKASNKNHSEKIAVKKNQSVVPTVKDKIYKCATCGKTFKQFKTLKTHLKNHVKARENECHICKQVFVKGGGLINHMKLRHSRPQRSNSKIKEDPPAVEMKSSKVKCKDEKEQKEGNENAISSIIQCGICSKICLSSRALGKHLRTHMKPNVFSCTICKKLLKTKQYLKKHITKVHGQGEIDNKCTVCEKHFKWRKNLATHMRIHTRKQISYECTYCGKQLKSMLGWKLHTRNHTGGNVRPFQCEICGKSFPQKNNLILHLRGHRGERPYQCEVCGKSFISNGALKKHRVVHTGERPYACEVCGMKFTCCSARGKHRQMHTGEMPFSCQDCGRKFRQYSNVVKHRNQRHSTEKHYVCSVCGKAFANASPLRRHMVEVHSNNQPFACDICGKLFKRKTNCTAHMKRAHGSSVQTRSPASEEQIQTTEVTSQLCSDCGMMLDESEQADKHLCSQYCSICGEMFPTEAAIHTHMLVHELEVVHSNENVGTEYI